MGQQSRQPHGFLDLANSPVNVLLPPLPVVHESSTGSHANDEVTFRHACREDSIYAGSHQLLEPRYPASVPPLQLQPDRDRQDQKA